MNDYLDTRIRGNLIKTVCKTDISVLFSELGDNSRIVSLAGHQKAKHLLSVFAHDELQSRLMLLQRCAQLCRNKCVDLDLKQPSHDIQRQLLIANPPNTFVFLLQFPYLPVFLLDAHDQRGARPVSRHLVQHLNLFLILKEQEI